jgi:shikimate dehydrogenase
MTTPSRLLLAGVMGWPVMHSRSPMIHNYWFQQQGLQGTYLPLAVEPGKLEGALRALMPLGFSGCNLTIPHKQDALAIVDDIEDTARKIGAISCVVAHPDGRLVGSNNDAPGFIRNLQQTDPSWRADAGPVVVIGAGGASRAVCYGLIQAGATEIRLVNRNQERAQQLAADLGGPINVYPWDVRNDLMAGAAMVVNTTSQGMVGQTALDVDLALLPISAWVSDVVYIPLETPLLTQARLRGNRTINGLGMLLHQGPLGWKAWFGIEPTVTEELRTLVEQNIRT